MTLRNFGNFVLNKEGDHELNDGRKGHGGET